MEKKKQTNKKKNLFAKLNIYKIIVKMKFQFFFYFFIFFIFFL